jgi:MFS family permease
MTYQRLIMAVFFLQPIAFGSWLPRIPDIQNQLGLGPAGLALALLGMPIGILLTLPFAGRFVARVGARAILVYGFPLYFAVVALPAFSPNLWTLFITLGLVGIAVSTLELGLNVKADQIEKKTGSMIMSTCHGFWGLGIMVGSLIGAGLAGLQIAPHWSIIIVALVSLPFCVIAARALPNLPEEAAVADPDAKPALGLPGRALLGICFFTFGITMTEGAVADWSAVFLRSVFEAEPAQAGLGYSLFALTLAAGRFVGDRLKARYGAVALARVCGVFTIIGVLVVTTAPTELVTLIGFAAIGIGASVGFPLAVTAAASLTDRPAASSVAILSFVALIGFLVGPPMIGFIAEHTGLRLGLATLLPMLVVSLLLTGMLQTRGKPVSAVASIEA